MCLLRWMTQNSLPRRPSVVLFNLRFSFFLGISREGACWVVSPKFFSVWVGCVALQTDSPRGEENQPSGAFCEQNLSPKEDLSLVFPLPMNCFCKMSYPDGKNMTDTRHVKLSDVLWVEKGHVRQDQRFVVIGHVGGSPHFPRQSATPHAFEETRRTAQEFRAVDFTPLRYLVRYRNMPGRKI